MMEGLQKLTPPRAWENAKEFYKNSIGLHWYKNIAVIQSSLVQLTFDFFKSKNIKSVCLPVTTGSVTSPMGLGSDSLPVNVDLFGIDTYLADSMQFHLEYMLRYLPEGVHYIMPTFRGEKADERHLCQFYHSEAEIVGTLDDVMNLIEQYILFLMENILLTCKKEIMELSGTTEHIDQMISIIKEKGICRITFNDAANLLENKAEYIRRLNGDKIRTITAAGEKELIKKCGGIVWLTNHDYLSIPFYQKKASDGTGLNADLLFGIGEVVGCGQRNETFEELMQALKEHNVDKSSYEWYVYMKEHYPMTTSGFGMGMERFILFLINHDDIRDTQLIPRFNGIEVLP